MKFDYKGYHIEIEYKEEIEHRVRSRLFRDIKYTVDKSYYVISVDGFYLSKSQLFELDVQQLSSNLVITPRFIVSIIDIYRKQEGMLQEMREVAEILSNL